MADKLFNCRFAREFANINLICFPWAGGGSNFYALWGKDLPDFIEVHAITLPGRESRFKEPCLKELNPLVDDLVEKIYNKFSKKKFAFFGHSLGSLLSFEVARKLKNEYNIEPLKMFISGASPSHSSYRKQDPKFGKMTDAEFKIFLQRLGGTPKEILDNDEIMELYLPALKADYGLLDQFDFQPEPGKAVVSCPIQMYDGDHDKKHDDDAWKELTSGSFSLQFLPGGHFFLKEKNNIDYLLDSISKNLA